MDINDLLSGLRAGNNITILKIEEAAPDEIYIRVNPRDFRPACEFLHKKLSSPVSTFFAQDKRPKQRGFSLYCVFLARAIRKWILVSMDIDSEPPQFESLSRSMFSASLFEREIKEMFGIEPKGNPDLRCLRLHEEVWPAGNFPLRKDFQAPGKTESGKSEYVFTRGEGEGIFEVPVGPVHAGIIGPGHFRFSVAGEPIINLETRLGFTHRGAEKLFEGRSSEGVRLAECVSGDASFSHSLAFSQAMEKIFKVEVPLRGRYIRAICLELERMYNHCNDIGGIALDVGFSFPAASAAAIKESIQELNHKLTGSRFLKGMNACGGLNHDFSPVLLELLRDGLKTVQADFKRLESTLNSSVSFMDRVDGTGVLKKKTAQDLGVSGLVARACGMNSDLRRDFLGLYEIAGFKPCLESSGDVLARLRVRIAEFGESLRLIGEFLKKLPPGPIKNDRILAKEGFGLGYCEGWRGPVLYWLETNDKGAIIRCKITDPSFLNWLGLAYCVLGDIIPDFPVCNKSFDLSYPGTDL
jgi:Ni,Fe-hydrogenase III large subunit/Ni,Fe-hydrogenase III component G